MFNNKTYFSVSQDPVQHRIISPAVITLVFINAFLFRFKFIVHFKINRSIMKQNVFHRFVNTESLNVKDGHVWFGHLLLCLHSIYHRPTRQQSGSLQTDWLKSGNWDRWILFLKPLFLSAPSMRKHSQHVTAEAHFGFKPKHLLSSILVSDPFRTEPHTHLTVGRWTSAFSELLQQPAIGKLKGQRQALSRSLSNRPHFPPLI